MVPASRLERPIPLKISSFPVAFAMPERSRPAYFDHEVPLSGLCYTPSPLQVYGEQGQIQIRRYYPFGLPRTP